MKSYRTSQCGENGFSLLEVLVSTVIGTAIILMMATAMRLGSDGFNEATRRVDSLVEARAALGVMADDVATMVGNGREDFGWQENDERFHEVWFLTLKPIEAQDPERAVGDVCLVHYFTAVTQDAPVEDAAFSRKLYRRFVSSGDLLQRLSTGRLSPPEADPSRAEAVAFNVTRFVAQPLARTTSVGPLVEWEQDNGLPISLGIDFQVVDGDTAALLRNEEDWNLTSDLARTLVLEDTDTDESNKGRDFQLNLEIGHAN